MTQILYYALQFTCTITLVVNTYGHASITKDNGSTCARQHDSVFLAMAVICAVMSCSYPVLIEFEAELYLFTLI